MYQFVGVTEPIKVLCLAAFGVSPAELSWKQRFTKPLVEKWRSQWPWSKTGTCWRVGKYPENFLKAVGLNVFKCLDEVWLCSFNQRKRRAASSGSHERGRLDCWTIYWPPRWVRLNQLLSLRSCRHGRRQGLGLRVQDPPDDSVAHQQKVIKSTYIIPITRLVIWIFLWKLRQKKPLKLKNRTNKTQEFSLTLHPHYIHHFAESFLGIVGIWRWIHNFWWKMKRSCQKDHLPVMRKVKGLRIKPLP